MRCLRQEYCGRLRHCCEATLKREARLTHLDTIHPPRHLLVKLEEIGFGVCGGLSVILKDRLCKHDRKQLHKISIIIDFALVDSSVVLKGVETRFS